MTEPSVPRGISRMAADRRDRIAQRIEELAQVGGWEWNIDTGDLYWSDNHFRLFGLEPNDVAPSTDFVLGRTHPDDREGVEEWLRSADETGLLPVHEYRIFRADGAVRRLRATVTISEVDVGEVRSLVGIVQDVTDQRQAESEIAARIAIADVLERWTSFEDGGIALLAALGQSLLFGAGAVWTPAGETLTAQLFWSDPSIDSAALAAATGGTALPMGLGLPGHAWARARPVYVEDIRALPPSARRDAAIDAGFVGALALPAVHPPNVLVVLELYSADSFRPSERLIRSLVGLGYELGEFLGHRHAQLRPQTITERERQVLQLAAEGRTGREIAAELGIAPATVKTHFENLYLRLQASGKASAVAEGLRLGLID